MPKRSDSYMADQRRRIAQAARACMLESGPHKLSLRQVCARASVSMGALYIHYRNRADLIFAAIAEDEDGKFQNRPPMTSWRDLEALIDDSFSYWATQTYDQTARLALQIASDTSVYKSVADVLANQDALDADWMRSGLQAMLEAGDVSLPLGTDASLSALRRLIRGFALGVVADPRFDFKEARATLLSAVSLLLGRVTPSIDATQARHVELRRQSQRSRRREPI